MMDFEWKPPVETKFVHSCVAMCLQHQAFNKQELTDIGIRGRLQFTWHLSSSSSFQTSSSSFLQMPSMICFWRNRSWIGNWKQEEIAIKEILIMKTMFPKGNRVLTPLWMTLIGKTYLLNNIYLFAEIMSLKWSLSRSLNSLKKKIGKVFVDSKWEINFFPLFLDKGRYKKKTFFFWLSFPNVGGWGGWFPSKVQTPQNPPKSPRKSPFSTQISI